MNPTTALLLTTPISGWIPSKRRVRPGDQQRQQRRMIRIKHRRIRRDACVLNRHGVRLDQAIPKIIPRQRSVETPAAFGVAMKWPIDSQRSRRQRNEQHEREHREIDAPPLTRVVDGFGQSDRTVARVFKPCQSRSLQRSAAPTVQRVAGRSF